MRLICYIQLVGILVRMPSYVFGRGFLRLLHTRIRRIRLDCISRMLQLLVVYVNTSD